MMSAGRVGTDGSKLSFDIENDDEFKEMLQLASPGDANKHKHVGHFCHTVRNDYSKVCVWSVLVILLAAGSTIILNATFVIAPIATKLSDMQFTCPASQQKPANFEDGFTADYQQAVEEETRDPKEFLAATKAGGSMHVDAWSRSYDDLKAALYDWKETQFAPYLEDGYSIYESACGHGLNLYITLDILNEVKGVEHMVVYGNEYVPEAATMAGKVFGEVPPAKAQKGTICAGDSSDLGFVPSNAFDLVFTGYLT
jgi:hypothetical protein